MFLLAMLASAFCVQQVTGRSPIAGSGGNNPPRAIVGPNQTIGVHPNTTVEVTLDGSQSYDPDSDPITYEWKDSAGTVVGTARVVQVGILHPGTYLYTLTVTDTHRDPQGNTAHFSGSALTVVEVILDVTPPLVDAPDITVNITDPGSATVSKSTKLSDYALHGATTAAVDDVDPHPQFLKAEANAVLVTGTTVFPEGDTQISIYYLDQAGNVGSSPAAVHVVDRQDNDLYIQNGVGNCFGTPCNDVIQRIRGGAVTDICTLRGGDVAKAGIIMDSSGRAVSVRDYGNFGVEMVRCSTIGAPPEQFAYFGGVGGVPPGDPEPFPGMTFLGVGGLSLARLREVVIDDQQNNGNPFVVNEDAYLLDLIVPAGSRNANRPVIYHVKQKFWENAPDLGPTLSQVGIGSPGAAIYFHSGSTYAARGGCLDRVKFPLSIHASGSAGGVSFNLSLGLFGSSGEICSWILDNVSGPHISGPPCAGPAPTDGSGYSIMDGLYAVVFDDYNGYALTLFSNSGATGSDGVLSSFSELPFDDPGNPGNFFQNPLFGCAVETEVRYDAQIGPPQGGGFWGASGVASTASGFVGTSPFSAGGVVFPIQTGGSSSNWIAQGIGYVGGITAWPPSVSAGAALSVIIRIESPVDVLVTDPNGKRLGMLNGAPVNDFGADGADTGAGSHPRFYAISKPVPGDYSVQSVGTDSGPYTVHVYSVDTSKPFGQHIFNSGMASPGSLSSQNFTLDTDGGIAFTNHPPLANPGPDQTVTAGANGMAMVNLDGSASSDPDGDSLSFSWAGPFGLVYGAQPQVTLPVGVSVLELTVTDGHGGSSSGNLTITVNAAGDTTPPVVTPPANISIPATEAAGARGNDSVALTSFLAAGSAVDDTDPSPTRLVAQVAGMDVDSSTLFPLGTTPVTFRFQDASGNIGSAVASVTVSLGTPRLAGAVVGKGRDASGNYFVDLRITDTGTGNARSVNINQLTFRTLSGTGAVGFNAALSGALPFAVGDIDASSSETVRLYLNLPPTVVRFSITETGTLQDVTGTSFSYSQAQAVIP
jgi:K319L-like, PKD domain/Bacterial Ig domain